jgi:hypothetical protein
MRDALGGFRPADRDQPPQIKRQYQCYDDFCHRRQWLSPAMHIAVAKQHSKTGGLVADRLGEKKFAMHLAAGRGCFS